MQIFVNMSLVDNSVSSNENILVYITTGWLQGVFKLTNDILCCTDLQNWKQMTELSYVCKECREDVLVISRKGDVYEL